MSIHVEFPDVILLATREERDVFVRKATIYVLGHLYEQGKISAGFAAQVMGCDRIEMYRLFTEHGFAIITYSEDEELVADAIAVLENTPDDAWLDWDDVKAELIRAEAAGELPH